MFNPKLQDFLKNQSKDSTLIGFAWSLYWRLSLAIFFWYVAVMAGLFILAVLLTGISNY